MKKVINGKIYDTDTAKHIGYYSADGSQSDFVWYEEDLYRKRTGEFFLCGHGGAASPYGRSSGDSSVGGSAIIPLSWEAAREWAENRLTADEYLEHFTASESDEKAAVIIYLPQSKLDSIKIEASKAGVSLSDYIVSKL